MGNASSSSSMHVVNKATYDIHLDLYKSKDVDGMVALKQYTLLPGQAKLITIGKSGANMRISGNGRTEEIRAVSAGEVLEIDKVRRTKPGKQMEALIPAQPSTTAAAESRSGSSSSDDDVSRQDWVDFKNRSDKDELQQLTRKLEREQLQKRQAEIRQKLKQQETKQEESDADEGWQRLESWK